MKKKYLIVFLVALALISVFTVSVAAEESYSETPNGFTYSLFKEVFLDPYAGSYCVMEERGVFTFYYPDVKPGSFYVNISGVDAYDSGIYTAFEIPLSFFDFMEFTFYGSPILLAFDAFESDFASVKYSISGFVTGLYSDIQDTDVMAVGFLFPGSNLSSVTVSFPYFAGGFDVYNDVGEVNSSNWQPFADIADVPTAPPSSDVSFLGVLGEMVEILIGGIVPFAGGVGSGLSNLAAAIFLTGTGDQLGLSVFGSVIIIFAGLALAIGLSKFVVGWLTSLGASD